MDIANDLFGNQVECPRCDLKFVADAQHRRQPRRAGRGDDEPPRGWRGDDEPPRGWRQAAARGRLMQNIGIAVMVCGGVGLALFYIMDTSVPTSFGRVHNIGLLQERQNGLMVSGVVALAGVVLTVAGAILRSPRR
jgi:hypothetical protein